MAIKLADVIENANTDYPVIDPGHSNVKGFHLLTDAQDISNISSGAQTAGGGLIVTEGGVGAVYVKKISSSYADLSTWAKVPTTFSDFAVVSYVGAGPTTYTGGEALVQAPADTFDFCVYDSINNGFRSLPQQEWLSWFMGLLVDTLIDAGLGSTQTFYGTTSGVPGDFNNDGLITVSDLLIMLGLFNSEAAGVYTLLTATGAGFSNSVFYDITGSDYSSPTDASIFANNTSGAGIEPITVTYSPGLAGPYDVSHSVNVPTTGSLTTVTPTTGAEFAGTKVYIPSNDGIAFVGSGYIGTTLPYTVCYRVMVQAYDSGGAAVGISMGMVVKSTTPELAQGGSTTFSSVIYIADGAALSVPPALAYTIYDIAVAVIAEGELLGDVASLKMTYAMYVEDTPVGLFYLGGYAPAVDIAISNIV